MTEIEAAIFDAMEPFYEDFDMLAQLELLLTTAEIAGLRRTRDKLTGLIEQYATKAVAARKAAKAIGVESTPWIDDYDGMTETVNALNKLLSKE